MGRLEPNDKSFGNYLFVECKSTLVGEKKKKKKEKSTIERYSNGETQFIRRRYRRRIYTHHADFTRVGDKRPIEILGDIKL